MKEVIKKSALGWLVFSLTVIAVGVAYAAISAVAVWDTLSSTKWNEIVTKVNDLDGRPNPTLTCVTKANSSSSSGVGWKNVDVACDAGYVLTGCWNGTTFSWEHWWRYVFPFSETTCRAWVYNAWWDASTYAVYARCCKIQ